MDALEGNNPYLVWKSIVATKQLLIDGSHRVLVIGLRLKPFKGPFLYDDNNFYIYSIPLLGKKI